MLLSASRRCRVLSGLLALVACGDFELLEPEPEPPGLAIHVLVVSDETTRYVLSGFLRSGTDARGTPNDLLDAALYVDGAPVLGDVTSEPGIRQYDWERTATATGDRIDSIRVSFPVIAGVSSGAQSITIPIPQREGPRDVVLTRGEDLSLRVSALASTAPLGLSGGLSFWALDVGRSCSGGGPGTFVSISGANALPADLRVPWSWLETLAADEVDACLRASTSFQVIDSPYFAIVILALEVAWRIRVGPV